MFLLDCGTFHKWDWSPVLALRGHCPVIRPVTCFNWFLLSFSSSLVHFWSALLQQWPWYTLSQQWPWFVLWQSSWVTLLQQCPCIPLLPMVWHVEWLWNFGVLQVDLSKLVLIWMCFLGGFSEYCMFCILQGVFHGFANSCGRVKDSSSLFFQQ
jgi:hypothetical protein